MHCGIPPTNPFFYPERKMAHSVLIHGGFGSSPLDSTQFGSAVLVQPSPATTFAASALETSVRERSR